MTFLTAGTLTMQRGDLGDFLDWWVVLAVADRRTAGAHARRGRRSGIVTARRSTSHRSFTPDDDDAEIAHFLAEAGFLHLARRGSTPDEMDEIVAPTWTRALPTLQPRRRPLVVGEDRRRRRPCVRMQYFHEHVRAHGRGCSTTSGSSASAGSPATGTGAAPSGNRIEALVKPIGVVEGISDVPWHKDCSLGMHSYRCCGLTVGISVTGADEPSGQLARRRRARTARSCSPAFVRRESDLPVVDLPTRTGDVTVHCRCTLHMSHSRRSTASAGCMYTGFSMPALDPDAARASLVALGQVREQAHRTVSQAPGYLG